MRRAPLSLVLNGVSAEEGGVGGATAPHDRSCGPGVPGSIRVVLSRKNGNISAIRCNRRTGCLPRGTRRHMRKQ
jgi:hypothetical protein